MIQFVLKLVYMSFICTEVGWFWFQPSTGNATCF